MRRLIMVGWMALASTGVFAEVIQFGGDETAAPNVAGTDIILNLWSGAYTDCLHGSSGDIGTGVQEGIAWGDGVVTKGLEITITADSSIGSGNLGGMQHYLGVDGDGKVTYGESLFFSFNQDVRLVGLGTAYGSNKRYGLRFNGHNTYVFASMNMFPFSSDTILPEGESLEVFGVSGSPVNTDVGLTGLVVETIPEPSTIGLLAGISGGLVFVRRHFIIGA